MKKTNMQRRSIVLLLVLLSICAALVGISIYRKGLSEQDILWRMKEDGSYVFINRSGDIGSVYAWEVLDERGNRIENKGYSFSNRFSYDLDGDKTLVIKSYTRTGSKTDYEQQSFKVMSSEVLGRKKYEIAGSEILENFVDLCIARIPRETGGRSIPTEEVMLHDGSRWNVDLNIPVDWDCPDILNRSHGFLVNGLLFLDDAFHDYRETRDPEIARTIITYIVDWVDQNQEYDADDQWQWHDDATACRVYRMAVYYDVLKDHCTPEEQKKILESMEYQAGVLADNRFYTAKHNHGMHQDIALLTYELLFGENLKAERVQIALGRLDEYLTFVYTPDGVHKEHSPLYAKDVLQDAIFLQKTTEKVSPEFSDFAGQIADRALAYLVHIMKPDSNLPPIGDSQGANGNVSSLLGEDVAQAERILSTNDIVFEEGGYGIFRSSWEDAPEEATWMMMVAATFSSTHKHGDDLEVLLYHKGNLITEAGKRDYNYLDEKTAWAYSGYAHNVLIVDDEAYPVKIGSNGFQSVYSEAYDTRIVDHSIGDTKSSVTGYEHRFDGIEQTRTLEYDRESNTVVVTDALTADRTYSGTLLWHVAAGVEVRQNKNTYEFYRNSELVATMDVLAADCVVELISGEGEYPYTTWLFDGKTEPELGKLIKINFAGEQGLTEVRTVFNLK